MALLRKIGIIIIMIMKKVGAKSISIVQNELKAQS